MTLHFLDMAADGNVSGLGQRAVPTAIASFFRGQPVGNLPGSYFAMGRAVCDTAASMVSQQPPLPIVITSGTDLSIARRAEKRTKVLQSQLNDLRRGVFAEAFDFCAQTGNGVVHDYVGDDGLVKLESVCPLEILVDHLDGMYRDPDCMHRYKYMSKHAAAKKWPKSAAIIKASNAPALDVISSYLMPSGYASSDMVEVIESWCLQRNGNKGRHTLCVSAGSIIDEPYDDDTFPFAVVRYRNRAFGFWGSGLMESVRPNQERVNQLIRKVQRGQDLASNLYIFSPEDDGGNMVNPNFITTKIATIIPYKPELGVPTLAKWDGTLQDLQQQIEIEFERVLRVEGLSDSQVNGEGAGRGLSSGVAVRAADDVQSRRLFHPTERFEEMCLRVSERVSKRNDQLAAKDKKYAPRGFVTTAGVNFLVSSEWAELAIPEGQSCVNMMKMNALPTTPQGRWASVQEWIQAGFVSQPVAKKLLQFPALDELAALDTAPFDLIVRQIEDLLDGKSALPYPRQPLKLVVQIATQAWSKMMQMRHDPEVEDAFENYLDYAQAKLDAEAAQAQPAEQTAMSASDAGQPQQQGGLAATDLVQQVAA